MYYYVKKCLVISVCIPIHDNNVLRTSSSLAKDYQINVVIYLREWRCREIVTLSVKTKTVKISGYQRSCSFCYNVLNFYFYIFENLIDIIILLDILLSLIGALSKYLFLSCFKSLRFLFLAFSIIATTFYNIFCNNNFTRSKCCFDNINIK